MQSTQEIWKPIQGFEGIYEVSNLGRLRSLFYVNNQRVIKPRKAPLIRSLTLGTDGYPQACFTLHTVKSTLSIHRIVAQSFIPNPQNLETVNHKNGDKTNNSVDNLEWVSRSANVKHAYDTGLKKQKSREDSPTSKLSNIQREEICLSLLSHSQAALKYNVSKSCIRRTRKNGNII